MTYSSLRDYMHAHVGQNWVVARRSPRIVARYGDDVVCLSQARYATLKALFDAQAPSVDNAARAMLAALASSIPALIILGDHIGNTFPGGNGQVAFDRCAIIGAVRDAIAQAEAAGVQ